MDFLKRLRQANVTRCMTTPKFARCVEWDASDWGLALAGEVGEVCNAIKKLNRGDGCIQDVVDEVGDVITYVDLLVNYFEKKYDIDLPLDKIIVNKFNIVSDRVKSDIKL